MTKVAKLGLALLVCAVFSACNGSGSSTTVPGAWSIDLGTGDRTLVAAIEGTDRTPRGLAFDAVADRIYLITSLRLIGVDAATGDSVVVADHFIGTGPSFSLLQAIAIDAAGGRAFVYDSPGVILAVDLLTGDRTIVSDASTGTGPTLQDGAAAMVYDPGGARLIVAVPGVPVEGDVVMAVDPATGDRTILSSSSKGTGVAFSFGTALAIAADFAGGRVFVAQESTILAVDLATGDRTTLYAGPPYRSAIAADIANSRLLQVRAGMLVSIDILTSALTILADANIGTGPALVEPRGLEIDEVRNRVVAAAYVVE